MASSLQSTSTERHDFTTVARRVYQYVARLLVLTGSRMKYALRTLQIARMMSVLANMSDQQLAETGITRSEIPEYALRLMSEE